MRLLGVASATLSLLLLAAPALRAQDNPAKPEKETKKDDKKDEKKDDKKDDKKKDEKGDEGDDEDDAKPRKDEKLPFNPFAKAKKGDWSSCVGAVKVQMGGGGGGGMQVPDQKMKMLVKVEKVTDDEVTLSMKQSGMMGMPGGPAKKATFSLKENPSLSKFFTMDDNAPAGAAGPKTEDWKVEDDKKTVGGKEFTCKKYSTKIKEKGQNGMGGLDGKLTLWITDQTKGWGLIAMTMKGSSNAQGMAFDISMDIELKGYGNGDTADFGKKPSDDGADDEGDDDDAPKSKDKKDDEKKDEKKKDDKKKKDDDD